MVEEYDEARWRAIVYYEEDIPSNPNNEPKEEDIYWIIECVFLGNKLVENATLAVAERDADWEDFKQKVRQARREARRTAAIRFIQSTLRYERNGNKPHFPDMPPELQERLVNLS